MGYELTNFKKLMGLPPNKDSSGYTDADMLYAELEKESARILHVLQQTVTSFPPKQGKIYLIQHQQSLILISDMLEKAQETQNSIAPGLTPISDQIETCLTITGNLLVSLEQHFPFYFDYSLTIPRNSFKKFTTIFEEKITGLSAKLKDRGTEPETLETFSRVFKPLLNQTDRLNHNQLNFWEDLFSQLSSELPQSNYPIDITDILQICVSCGYNHPAFYHYCCKYFSNTLEKCEHIDEQYRTLRLFKKNFQQITKTLDGCYNPNLPPIDESLIRYLDAELDYLKSMEITAADLSSGGLLEKNYKVTFTVRQLAIFIHLQVESGIILTKSPKALHQYVTKYYSTVEQEKISDKSFKNAYYGYVAKDIEKVIEKIAAMLAIAQEKY